MAGGTGQMVTGIIGSIIGDVSGKLAARERTKGMFQQAQDLETQATLEKLNAQTTEGDLRDQLLHTLSANNAAFAASGIALGSPSAAATVTQDTLDSERQIQASNLGALLRVGSLRRNAAALRSGGKTSAIIGSLNSAAAALQGGGNAGLFDGGGGAKPVDNTTTTKSTATYRSGTRGPI